MNKNLMLFKKYDLYKFYCRYSFAEVENDPFLITGSNLNKGGS